MECRRDEFSSPAVWRQFLPINFSQENGEEQKWTLAPSPLMSLKYSPSHLVSQIMPGCLWVGPRRGRTIQNSSHLCFIIKLAWELEQINSFEEGTKIDAKSVGTISRVEEEEEEESMLDARMLLLITATAYKNGSQELRCDWLIARSELLLQLLKLSQLFFSSIFLSLGPESFVPSIHPSIHPSMIHPCMIYPPLIHITLSQWQFKRDFHVADPNVHPFFDTITIIALSWLSLLFWSDLNATSVNRGQRSWHLFYFKG